MKRVTLADVAQVAGVDPSVVSRVINEDSRLVIKPETRERVVQAIEDLNYTPNAAARSLRTAQSGTYGLLIPDFANPMYAQIIKGAEEAANAQGALLLTGTAQADCPERYVRMLVSGQVEGMLLAAGGLTTHAVELLVSTGRPIVSVNQRIPGIRRMILADDERASQLVVEHLVELGHTRIAHIRGPRASDTAKRRLAGYRRAVKQAELAESYVLGNGYTSEAGASAMLELLSLDPRPTAVLVANVAAAVGALAAARRAGVHVPREVSVASIHDLPLADDLAPALTTVRMPLAQMGRLAMHALVDQDVTAGRTVVREPTELVVRESTAPPLN